MATITWVTAQSYVIIAATGFGIGGQDPTTLPAVPLAALDGPTNSIGSGGRQLWNYGIPAHEIEEDGVEHLIDWFQTHMHGQGLRVQAKGYGGFVVNLIKDLTDIHGIRRRFNFHIKIKAASMSMGTLLASGAKGAAFDSAHDAMFPPLGGK